jgi:hypothetical protein
MQRIIDPTAVASLPAPPTLTGTTGYFGPAVPGVSVATRFRYWVACMWQEELMAILAAASVTADTTATVFNQVVTSIQILIASAIGAIPHGVQVISSSGNFTVPAGVTVVDVELWGGGSGSWASVSGGPGGGGGGGGYTRKRVTGLTPAGTVAVTIGAAGAAGTTVPAAPTAGGATSFASYCSASGGAINGANSTSVPPFGNRAGVGSSGDLNAYGSDGGNATGFYGGFGGGAAHGGGASVTGNGAGLAGYAPGGGASGAGTGGGGTTPANGAAGAAGLCIVRW